MAGGGMSHPARAPRSGIDGQTNAAQGRYDEPGLTERANEAERMSHPARAPRSGIDNPSRFFRWNRGSSWVGAMADAVGVSSSVRPGRVRNRSKPDLDEKIKKPADGVPKKSPPARKAPARGRYVDEYARPTV
jgi:hypothetical protein